MILDKEGELAPGQIMYRKKFTGIEEDWEKAIIKFIIKKKAYSRVRSPSLFKKMEAENTSFAKRLIAHPKSPFRLFSPITDPHKEDQRSKRNLQPKCCANFSLHQQGEDGGWGEG